MAAERAFFFMTEMHTMETNVVRYRLEELSAAIVDDHEVVLEGFKSYMVKNGMRLVETFKTARKLLDYLQFQHFDVYIIDVELPDMEASLLIDEIRRLDAQARIIINTMHEEMWVVRKMSEKKVDGVVYKSGDLGQLLEAVVCVGNGGQYYCTKFRQMSNRSDSQVGLLSKREVEVLQAIARGLSTKAIAQQLYISENTVETHRQNMFSKLKAHNMAELIVKAISCGYIDPKSIG